jgi:hypothetical protein
LANGAGKGANFRSLGSTCPNNLERRCMVTMWLLPWAAYFANIHQKPVGMWFLMMGTSTGKLT